MTGPRAPDAVLDAAARADVTRLAAAPGSRRERVARIMRGKQEAIVSAFEALDGAGRFRPHDWDRPGGGGGRARVIEGGRVFERGGVNFSAVHGDRVPPSLARQHPGTEGLPFFATGVSIVLHPVNPHVPAFHANYRYFEVGHGEESGVWWFGGGADLTPSHPREEDVIGFHRALHAQCEAFPQADYEEMKRVCDDYFAVRHRAEMRGVGGIFFDQLSPSGQGDFESDLAFVRHGLDAVVPAYGDIVERRREEAWSPSEKDWQLLRRGRYVEFNLVYDRGTTFGLQTRGNVEAILMSMPPLASWRFDHRPEPGSREARALRFFHPRDWASLSPDEARRAIDEEWKREPDAATPAPLESEEHR